MRWRIHPSGGEMTWTVSNIISPSRREAHRTERTCGEATDERGCLGGSGPARTHQVVERESTQTQICCHRRLGVGVTLEIPNSCELADVGGGTGPPLADA